jgi:hypothetical protein
VSGDALRQALDESGLILGDDGKHEMVHRGLLGSGKKGLIGIAAQRAWPGVALPTADCFSQRLHVVSADPDYKKRFVRLDKRTKRGE